MKKIGYDEIPNPTSLYHGVNSTVQVAPTTRCAGAGDMVWVGVEDQVAGIIMHTVWYSIANEIDREQ